jgi:hypothetical protein
MKLSPLNFAGLVATANMSIGALPIDHPARASARANTMRRALECWKCPECYQSYDDEDEALECCDDNVHDDTPVSMHREEGISLCPICTGSYPDAREASDCCLWKDFDAHTRWAMADRVDAGELWIDVLGVY